MKVQITAGGKRRELRVARTTRTLVEWQRQSGHPMTWLKSDEGQMYALAFMAFCALHNAGFNPDWEQLLDVDTEDWKFIRETGDKRAAADAVEQPSSPEDSAPAAGSGGAKPKATPGSKHSSKPKGSSRTK